MSEKKAQQENPAQPAGWAQGNPVNPNAHPGGELIAIEQGKRVDTATWQDVQNRSPMDNVNPAQPPGFAVPEPTMGPMGYQDGDPAPPMGPTGVVARVIVEKTANSVVGGRVVLAAGPKGGFEGDVIAENGDEFGVRWADTGERTWERKADYELEIVAASIEGRQKAAGAGVKLCPTCLGAQRDRDRSCSTCGGVGNVSCDECKGKGFTEDGKSCSSCWV